MYLPPPPPTQGIGSPTFVAPPLDGSSSISGLVEFHRSKSSTHPLFVYKAPTDERVQITWSTFADAVCYAADTIMKDTGLTSSPTCSPTIAVLAVADSITYSLLVLGILRAGFTPFPISPRNSAPAVLHLLDISEARHVYISQDEAMKKLMESIAMSAGHPIAFYSMDQFNDMSSLNYRHTTHPISPQLPEPSDNALIIHSSGSTGFPKVTRLLLPNLLQYARIPYYGDVDLCGRVISLHSVPMFHMQGIAFVLRAIATGFVLAVFPPHIRPTPPSPSRVLRGIRDDSCTMLACVPSFLEAWSSDESAIQVLRKLEAIIFSGAPLSQKAGDHLANSGVKLCMYYAGTEVGSVSKFIPRIAPTKDWQYVTFSPHFEARFIPQDSPNLFELVAVESAAYTPGAFNTSFEGRNALATGDLFIRHPTDPNLWRVYGRADDLIMLSTGEKTNPGPIEFTFLQNPKISGAVMFGRGRPHNGIILELQEAFLHMLEDPHEKQKLEDLIWDLAEQANAVAPSHSRLYREMILFAVPSKPFQRTAKNNIQRKAILESYKTEIEQAYSAFGHLTDLPIPLEGPSDYRTLVNTILTNVLGEPIASFTDIFDHGCDSAQATRISNMISASLRLANPGMNAVPVDVVYRYPCPEHLIRFVECLMAEGSKGITASEEDELSKRTNYMRTMVTQLTEGIPHRTPAHSPDTTISSSPGDVVLLTGTTGALGSYLLAELANHPDISHIYAINREQPRDSRAILQRQIDSFSSRHIDPSILQNGKITLAEVDISSPHWDSKIQFLHNVTIVIHAAWPVDFNKSLSSFSGALQGVRNLIDFTANLSQARLMFISSTGLFRNWPSDELIPEGPASEPAVAAGLGYTESKWVAEQVLEIAAERLRIPISIVRIGQLSGGNGGAWNKGEWFPSMVQSAHSLGCLPVCDRVISWLPVRDAAHHIITLRRCPSRYFHIEHPQPVSWLSIFQPLAETLQVSLVPFEEWLLRVRVRAASDARFNNSNVEDPLHPRVLRILPYFESKDRNGQYHMAQKARVSLENTALSLGPLQSDIEPLGIRDIEQWIRYWRSIGLLE